MTTWCCSLPQECSISGDGAEERLFSFVGMMGFPLLPVARFPDASAGEGPLPASAMFTMHALKDPRLPAKLVAFVETGRPVHPNTLSRPALCGTHA